MNILKFLLHLQNLLLNVMICIYNIRIKYDLYLLQVFHIFLLLIIKSISIIISGIINNHDIDKPSINSQNIFLFSPFSITLIFSSSSLYSIDILQFISRFMNYINIIPIFRQFLILNQFFQFLFSFLHYIKLISIFNDFFV